VAFVIPENLRSRRDVPPPVGALARLLADHLDYGATVWWEPLFSLDDERPDLVVLVPDTGMLVLEVLEAKKGAMVGVSDGTLTVRSPDGEVVSVRHPLAKARAFADEVRARAREAGIDAEDELPVLAAGVFGYIDRRTARERGIDDAVDLGACLFRDDIDRMNDSTEAARQGLASMFATPARGVISEAAERLYRAVIHPDTVLTPVQGELAGVRGAITRDVKALDREQEALAKTLGAGHRVIRGVAGSGKTVILVHRARLLAQLHSKDRVLVTCYNRSLKGFLERQLEPYKNVTVATLHHQMYAILGMASEEPYRPDRTEDMAETARRALAALDKLANLGVNYEGRLFDHVLVDEAQDLPLEALQFAVRMLRHGSESLLVVADAAQTLSGRKGFTWKEAGIVATGRTRVLTRNYRNTRQILDFAWSFLSKEISIGVELDDPSDSTDVVVPPEASERSGPLPVVQKCPSRDAEVLFIARQASEWLKGDVAPGDVAILYGSRYAGGGGFNWIDKIGMALDQARVPWYWPTDPSDPTGKATVGSRRDQVMLSTVHSAKGLEFPRVILCAFLDEHPPDRVAESRRLIYVGMTRAVDHLVLTASGEHRFIADLERGPAA
jgi:UvrD-like helicase family protein/AAA domain-containing protein